MNSAHYIHNDLHLNNIAYSKINHNQIITIIIDGKNYKLKSYGYQFSIIDYGEILHKNFNLNIKKRKRYDDFVRFNRDFSMFFINTLTRTSFAIKKRVKIAPKLFDALKSKPELYQRIKLLVLSIYPELSKSYAKYEKTNKIDRFILYEVVQFLAIYDKEFLCNIFNSKYEENVLPNSILEYIKLNMKNAKSLENIIKYLIHPKITKFTPPNYDV